VADSASEGRPMPDFPDPTGLRTGPTPPAEHL